MSSVNSFWMKSCLVERHNHMHYVKSVSFALHEFKILLLLVDKELEKQPSKDEAICVQQSVAIYVSKQRLL